MYTSVIRSLNSFGKFEEGIELCTDVLEQLGETLTINGTNEIYTKEAEDVRKMVKNQSQRDLINLPLIANDKKKVGTLFFIFKLHYCFSDIVSKAVSTLYTVS